MNLKAKTQKLYAGLGWVSLFSLIRFWTGSFTQLEEGLPDEGKILDLGCGYGIFANYLGLCSDKRQVLGVEIDQEKLKFANRNVENVSFVRGDVTKMKLPKSRAVVIADVLHHLRSYQEQETLVKNCFKILEKKGSLFITEVDNKPFWKLILARLTDFLLCPLSPILYRYQPEMIALLKKYFVPDKIKVKRLKNNPFPHVVYICQKN